MPHFTLENISLHILIAVPTFFILRWLFKKIIKNDKFRIISNWVGTLLLTPFLYLATVSIVFTILFREPTRDFERTTWSTDSTNRYQMADDIIKSKILIDKTPAQLQEILGNPTYKYPKLNKWHYHMGWGSGGLGFMFHVLEVNFNKDKVISVYHGKIND